MAPFEPPGSFMASQVQFLKLTMWCGSWGLEGTDIVDTTMKLH